jgi:hypothetical protein
MVFVCFLSPSLGELGIENTQRIGYKSYHIAKLGRFFLSHIYHPIPAFRSFILRAAGRRNTQCDNKKLSHECYYIDEIKINISHEV